MNRTCHVIAFAVVAALAACVGQDSPPADVVVTAADTQGLDSAHRLALDVRTASYVIDARSGPVDARFVDVITPSGLRIPIEDEIDRMTATGQITRDAFEGSYSIRPHDQTIEFAQVTFDDGDDVAALKWCNLCVCDDLGCICVRIPCPRQDPPGDPI